MDPNQARGTVLVVDDERGPRESLRIILKPTYLVLTASSGTEALEILRTIPVDLITIDLNMPGLKGGELMRSVRREFPDVEIIVITGWGSVDSASEAVRWGIADYLQKPFDVVQVIAAVTRAMVRQLGRRRMIGFLERLGNTVGREREIAAILADLDSSPCLQGRLQTAVDEAARRARESEEPLATMQMLEVLAETIEAKDLFMLGHARRTTYYAGLLADRLCLAAEQREQVRISAFLHDVGKVGVPEEVLAKPGPLDPEELDVVQAHAEVGARIVQPLGIAGGVAPAIRHHHERWDGQGYPDGLRGEDIPFTSRIIQLADVFDAMTSDRPHRRAKGRERTLLEIREVAGTQFDPELAKEFVTLLESQASDVDPEVLADVVSTPKLSQESAAPSVRTGGVGT
jgi:response regulator RpfG family c-di-GMP phosphodiesterase